MVLRRVEQGIRCFDFCTILTLGLQIPRWFDAVPERHHSDYLLAMPSIEKLVIDALSESLV